MDFELAKLIEHFLAFLPDLEQILNLQYRLIGRLVISTGRVSDYSSTEIENEVPLVEVRREHHKTALGILTLEKIGSDCARLVDGHLTVLKLLH